MSNENPALLTVRLSSATELELLPLHRQSENPCATSQLEALVAADCFTEKQPAPRSGPGRLILPPPGVEGTNRRFPPVPPKDGVILQQGDVNIILR